MFKLKYILTAILISSGLLIASTLETSEHFSNLEMVTEKCAHKKIDTQDANVKEMVVKKIQKVETVNFSLSGCNGIASFPVTVRSSKKQGE